MTVATNEARVVRALGRPLSADEHDALRCQECPGCGRYRGEQAGAPDPLCHWLSDRAGHDAWRAARQEV